MDPRAYDRKTPDLTSADSMAEEGSTRAGRRASNRQGEQPDQVTARQAVQAALSNDYEQALREYLNGTVDLALERAFRIGREAFAAGLAALDIARIHHDALLRVSARELSSDRSICAVTAAGELFIRSLIPFDRSQRPDGQMDAVRRMNARLEEEARRIAHALHDEAGQLLVAVHLTVSQVASELPPAARERLQQVSVLLDQVSDQLRHVAHELRPVVLDDFGLVAAVKFLAEGVSRRGGFAVAVEASMDERLPSSIETAVYRIVQETLNNVRKHARAGHVTVRLWTDRGMIRYSIEDDGVGFEHRPDRSSRTKACLGLRGIRERLADLGGTLTVTTGPGRGTILDIGIPRDDSGRCPARRVTDARRIQRAS